MACGIRRGFLVCLFLTEKESRISGGKFGIYGKVIISA